jgi:hypothetical protein
MSYAITFTTINAPIVLESYFGNLEYYGHLQDALFVIVGDKKTPNQDVRDICETLGAKGMQIAYLDVVEQLKLAATPLYAGVIGMLQWNSDVRRNIGYLYAAAQGADVIISIDDDNYALPQHDYIGNHSIVGTVPDIDTATSKNGWLNVCQMLDFGINRPIYPRGFLVTKMHEDTFDWGAANSKVVAANSGLWTLSPDVDAITNIVLLPTSKGYESWMRQVALGQDTWCPLNSQNTSFMRQALPAFFFIPQGFKYNHQTIDRYGDIWMGFLVEKVAQHMGQTVTYGAPLVAHLRNKHNYIKDLSMEVGGMVLNEQIARWIIDAEIPAECDTYATAYMKLMRIISQRARETLDADAGMYFQWLVQWAETWCEACSKVL